MIIIIQFEKIECYSTCFVWQTLFQPKDLLIDRKITEIIHVVNSRLSRVSACVP